MHILVFVLVFLFATFLKPSSSQTRFVINTWNFSNATRTAWNALETDYPHAIDAAEIGVTQCELEQCDHSVGFGGSPNEFGETTLDALIINGKTMEMGAVANLKQVKSAAHVARKVLEKTYHTLLVGEDATNFAKRIGFETTNLSTPYSTDLWKKWVEGGRNPNYWKDSPPIDPKFVGHDTIGMVVRDKFGDLACATSTNGLTFRIQGRVGDGPIPGSGCYVENGVGGAAATGLGDIMMRFLPAYRAVIVNMKYRKMSPKEACVEALDEIAKYFPKAFAGLVCVNDKGEYGAAAIGDFQQYFHYSVRDPTMKDVQVRFWKD
jgi:N4-(beta-N-acetylglucosaminyl)-L-asparaginase